MEARLADTAATVGSPEQIRQFVLSGLSRFGCPVEQSDGAVPAYRITVSDPRLRGPGVPAVIETTTFDPEAALEDPDLTAVDLSHPLVRRLIEQVKAGFFAGGAGSGRVAYAATPDVREVTALAHVIARYAYTPGGETTNAELLIPIAAALDGKAQCWGREGGAASAIRLETRSSDLLTVTMLMLYPRV